MSDLFTLTIEGANGSEWVVHGPGSESSPVRLEEGDVGEFYDAPVAVTSKARVGQPGSSYRGHRVLERNIVLRLTTFDTSSSLNWSRVDSDLRRAFSYDEDVTLRVSTELSGERYIKVRLAEEPSLNSDHDPLGHRVGRWVFTLTAYDPFWYSDTYTDEYVFDGLNWYGDGVWVDNPTDVECWPSWVLTSPAKFILPDWDGSRQIVIPFQPLGRTAVVQSDPMEEMVVANDDTLLWAEMNGQFFMNPVPAYTDRTFVPVCVDPLPNLPIVLPNGWREWIASEIAKWAKALGAEGVFQTTPAQLGQKIRNIITGATPDWLEALSPTILGTLVPNFIADRIVEAWGSVGNMAGATAQVRLNRRWSRPWGLE